MKRIALIGIALAIFGSTQAQETPQNVVKESKTTVQTIKDSDGERKMVKTATTSSSQELKFQDAESNALNKDLAPTAVSSQTTITITTPSGKTRQVDEDRSARYVLNNEHYYISIDEVGYSIFTTEGKKVGVLRHVGYNSYLITLKNMQGYASFDANGNLNVQNYDAKRDEISQQTLAKQLP